MISEILQTVIHWQLLVNGCASKLIYLWPGLVLFVAERIYIMALVIKKPLKDQVYDIIKDRIMSSEYRLGEKINIKALSQELNVSSTPIRDALTLLEKEGLVTISQYAGPQVVQLNSAVFHEVFDSVLVVLLGGYEFCIYENRIPLLVSLLSESIDRQKAIVHTASNRAFAEATIAVDTAIITACNNSRLAAIYNGAFSLQTLLLIYDYQTQDYDRMQNIREHEAILEMIASGSSQEARELLKKHYARSIMFAH